MLQDLRFGFKLLWKEKAFTVTALLTLALVHRRQYGDLHGAARGDSGAAALRRTGPAGLHGQHLPRRRA